MRVIIEYYEIEVFQIIVSRKIQVDASILLIMTGC